MNAANESSPAPSLRRLPFSVRVAPHFVNALAAVLPEDAMSEEIEGLLFGIVETGFSVLRMFHLSSPAAGIGRQANFAELLTRSKKNPQLAGFTLLGWFSVRKVEGLQPDDIAFHERNFDKPNDLALIVKVEPESELSFELYCRVTDGTFTMNGHRSGTIRISNASPIVSPLEVPMEVHRDVHIPNRPVERELEEDDSFAFLREAFASSTKKAIERLKSAQPEEKEQAPVSDRGIDPATTRNAGSPISPWALAFGTAGAAAAAPARIPQETPQPVQTGDHAEEPEEVRLDQSETPIAVHAPKGPATAPATPDAVLIRSEEPRTPPAPDYLSPKPKPPSPQAPSFEAPLNDAPAATFVPRPAEPQRLSRFPAQALRALPWRTLALIFVLVAGATFGLIYLRSAHAKGTLPQFVQAVWPTPGLDLKIAANGDRLQLSWNRNIPAVRNAREAVLDINDGPSRHQILLANSELGNGSVLYLPSSDDVMFRLQVHGAGGQNATESLRVVGTPRSNALEVSRPKDSPSGEPEPPAGNVASSGSGPDTATNRAGTSRASLTPKPERGGSGDTRRATRDLPAAAASGAIAKAKVPRNPSASSGPTPPTREPEHVGASAPAANTVASNPPRTDTAPNRDTGGPPQSDSSTPSSVQNANATDTAQLQRSKPDEPVAPAENTGSKSASVQTPAPAGAAAPKTNTSGAQPVLTYQPPRPLKQVLPRVFALPPGAADAAGEVRVVVRVDESGQVIDARIVEGRRVGSMLANAALTAARQWIFEPASLRGKHIASEHTIVFQFRH